MIPDDWVVVYFSGRMFSEFKENTSSSKISIHSVLITQHRMTYLDLRPSLKRGHPTGLFKRATRFWLKDGLAHYLA